VRGTLVIDKLEADTLDLTKRLVEKGVERDKADAIVDGIFNTIIYNVIDNKEVTEMVATAIDNVFKKSDERFEKINAKSDKLRAESEAKFEKSRAESEERFQAIRHEIRADVRKASYFIIATIVTIALAFGSKFFF
jgi:hypothetical protein